MQNFEGDSARFGIGYDEEKNKKFSVISQC